MNKLYYLLLSAAISFTFFSCSSDDGPSSSTPNPYAGLNSEQVKEQLESDAMAFLTEIEGLEDEQAFKTLSVFAELNGTDGSFLRSMSTLRGETDESDVELDGKYVWNAENSSWDISELEGQREYHFPSTVTGTKNTEKIVLKLTGANGNEESALVDAKLYSNEKSIGSAVGNMTGIQEERTLKFADLTLSLGQYVLALKTNAAQKSTLTFSLKKGELVLLNLLADMSEDYSNLEEIEEPEDANVSLTILDRLVMIGKMNMKAYDDEDNRLSDEYYSYNSYYERYLNGNSEKYYTAVANNFNKQSNIALKTISGAFIAKLEAKAAFDENEVLTVSKDEQSGKWYDPVLGKFVDQKPEYTLEYWTSYPILRFEDDTTVEASVYFSKGFDKIIKWVNNISARYN